MAETIAEPHTPRVWPAAAARRAPTWSSPPTALAKTEPEPEAIEAADIFEQLRRRFKAIAANNNLQLRVRNCPYFIYSDRTLLYRILQNFLEMT